MCTVSMIGDFYHDKWNPLNPNSPFYPQPTPLTTPTQSAKPINLDDLRKLLNPPPTREEFDKLKKEVEDMKELLKRAVEYDKKNNEPHCEIEEKVKLLKAVAEIMGVDLSEIFGGKE